MKRQLRGNRLPSRLVLMIVATMLAMLGAGHAAAGVAAAARSAPQQALLGRGPVLDDNQSDCVLRLNREAKYTDDDAAAACTKLLADPAPKSPATYQTLTSCFIDGVFNKSYSDGIAEGKCRTKAAAGDPSTTCSASIPSPFRELSDARVDGASCRAPSLGVGTNGGQYAVGDSITVCYTVPGPGPVTVTDMQKTGSTVLVSGTDDGRGDCLSGTITPPLGQECVSATFGGSSTQACFQVCNALPCSGGTTTASTTTTTTTADAYYVLNLDGYGGAVFVGRKSDVRAGSVPECGACTTVPKILATLAGPFPTQQAAEQDFCQHATNFRGATSLRVSRVDAYGVKDLDADAAPSCSH